MTPCRKSSLLRTEFGVTLVEMMIVVAISAIIMAAVMQTWMFTTRSFVAMGNYSDLDQNSRNALDHMTADLRQSKVVTYYATNVLSCSNLDGTTFTYAWDPATKVVYKSQ